MGSAYLSRSIFFAMNDSLKVFPLSGDGLEGSDEGTVLDLLRRADDALADYGLGRFGSPLRSEIYEILRRANDKVDVKESLTTQLLEAKEHLRYLMSVAPHPSCELFHHAKRDRHAFDEPCPVVARYRARLKQVEYFLSPNVATEGRREQPGND